MAGATEGDPVVSLLCSLPSNVLPEVTPGPERGEEDDGAQGQAPEDETSEDAGQAQVPQLPPPGADLVSESPGIVIVKMSVSHLSLVREARACPPLTWLPGGR